MKKEQILTKVNLSDSFGKTLNKIQRVAMKTLSKKSVNRFLKVSANDAAECDGMDGILFNGQYFDWRLFNIKKKEIILAFLDYFNEEELDIIYSNL